MKIKAIVCVLVALAILAYCWFFVRSVSLSAMLNIKTDDIDKIVIGTEWGQQKKVTSKPEIQAILSYLEGYTYRRKLFAPLTTGYLYYMAFYSGENVLAGIEISSNFEINRQKYEPTREMDYDAIKKIVGLYPPGVTDSRK